MALQVTVHLQPAAAKELHGRRHGTAEAREIIKAVKDAGGGELEPVHPGAQDAELAKHFSLEVPDAATAEEVIRRLQNCKAVEAAYLKPPAALP
jgi:hypothetical protein